MKKFYKVTYWNDYGKEHIALFTSRKTALNFFNELSWNGIRTTFNDSTPINIDIF